MPNWFPTLTVDGFECILVLPRINWRRRPRITHTIGEEATEGRTGIDAIAAEHDDVRLSFDYGYLLSEEEAGQFIALVQSLDPEARLLVPLWPEIAPAADYAATRVWDAQHWINVDVETGAYSLDEDTGLPESVGLAMCAPLELPTRKPINDLEAEVVLRVEEDAPWEARVEIHSLALAAWNFEADFAQAPDDGARWQLQRRRMGRGRVTARTGTDAPTKRTQAPLFTWQSRAELRKALTFWVGKLGPRDAFTVPLCLRPGWDGTPGDVPVMQARFASETFSLEFAPPDTPYEVVARARVAFTQQFALAGGEPSQALPALPYLFRLWWLGSENDYAWTDWVRDYTHAGVTYQPRPVEVKSLHETMRLGQSEWELLVTDFDGNPLRVFGRLARERKLMIEVRQFNPAVANTATLVFKGEVKKAPNKGPLYTAKLALFGGVLKYLTPSCTCQNGCNATLGDEICGVDLEAHKATGQIGAMGTTTIDIETADAGGANAWALGYALFGEGDDVELRYILTSTPVTGGQRITMHRPLWTAEVGTAVVLYPGCDQQYYSGCARWENQHRYFGAPHKPEFIASIDSGYRQKTGK